MCGSRTGRKRGPAAVSPDPETNQSALKNHRNQGVRSLELFKKAQVLKPVGKALTAARIDICEFVIRVIRDYLHMQIYRRVCDVKLMNGRQIF